MEVKQKIIHPCTNEPLLIFSNEETHIFYMTSKKVIKKYPSVLDLLE